MAKPLTGPQYRALHILRERQDAGRLTNPRSIALDLWPDSPGWQKRTRRYGSNANGAVGGTMPMKAATVLWRLADRGCATVDADSNRWRITERGRAVLAGTAAPRPLPDKPKPAPIERTPK